MCLVFFFPLCPIEVSFADLDPIVSYTLTVQLSDVSVFIFSINPI